MSVFYIQAESPGNLKQFDWILLRESLLCVMHCHNKVQKSGEWKDGAWVL